MRSERDLSYSLHALPKSERAYAELEHWRGRLVGEYPSELPRADAPYPGKMHDTLKGASTAPDPSARRCASGVLLPRCADRLFHSPHELA